MSEIIGRCGYRCDLCPAYVGNIKDDADRQRASDGWFKYFGFRVPPAEIDCRGCSPDCVDKDCPVRPCAEAKAHADCSLCGEFPCDKLETRMDFIPKFLAEHPDLAIPPEDRRRFIEPYESRERMLMRGGKGKN